jgi:hypothetical protein
MSSTVTAYVKNSILSENISNGISIPGSQGGGVYLSHSTILGSFLGINLGSGGVVFSAANNDLFNNHTDTSGALTPAPEQ